MAAPQRLHPHQRARYDRNATKVSIDASRPVPKVQERKARRGAAGDCCGTLSHQEVLDLIREIDLIPLEQVETIHGHITISPLPSQVIPIPNREDQKKLEEPSVICPHCGGGVEIESVNCGIFRHGIMKATGVQMEPHLPKDQCEQLVKTDAIRGCGKPFRLVDKKAEVCDYI